MISWFRNSGQLLDNENQVIAPFIIDLDKNLLIADRHSEHVACAGGKKVLSAGEITFLIEESTLLVTEVTNQSTGYCPEPESWSTVNVALEKTGIEYPESFTQDFLFRYCENCELLNIIKEDWFVCVQCNNDLSKTWNIDRKKE